MLQLQKLIKRGETSLPDPEVPLKPGPLIQNMTFLDHIDHKKTRPINRTGGNEERLVVV